MRIFISLVAMVALAACVQKADDDVDSGAHTGHDDVDTLKVLAGSSNRLQQALLSDATLFARPADAGLSADERTRALQLFADVLDHCYAFDAIAAHHLDVWKKKPASRREASVRHFDLGFLAYVEKLSLALVLVEQTINKPQFEKLLDEGDTTLSIPSGAYAKLKWNVVHVEDAGKTLAAQGYLKTLKKKNDALTKKDPRYGYVLARVDERYQQVRRTLTTKAPELFGGNTVDIGVDVAHAAWFPVQAKTAEWMGDTRVRRQGKALISVAQVLEAVRKSEPGDIIVERRNWYLSNIGLPGFWPHAALYVGNVDELSAWAKDDEVDAHFAGGLVAHLEKTFPEAWKSYSAKAHDGSAHRIVEAVSEGVVFNAAEESLRADYVAAMRPKLSKLEKAKAIARAFAYAGRPYDFDFDFYTDAALVCSELVYKSYEPREDQKGITLGLEKVVGRMTLGPNSIVRTFDQTHDEATGQLAFAWFLDGKEKEGTAAFVDEQAFRDSWKRPKWDIVQK